MKRFERNWTSSRKRRAAHQRRMNTHDLRWIQRKFQQGKAVAMVKAYVKLTGKLFYQTRDAMYILDPKAIPKPEIKLAFEELDFGPPVVTRKWPFSSIHGGA